MSWPNATASGSCRRPPWSRRPKRARSTSRPHRARGPLPTGGEGLFRVGAKATTAQVRRDVLARILPKLAIADRVELADRHVRVRGNRGTYLIHIGSANVLTESGDPGRRVLVPFEGDEVLSLVLSKIVMLAADHRITAPVIRSQLP